MQDIQSDELASLVGELRQRSGSYQLPLTILAIVTGIVGILVYLFPMERLPPDSIQSKPSSTEKRAYNCALWAVATRRIEMRDLVALTGGLGENLGATGAAVRQGRKDGSRREQQGGGQGVAKHHRVFSRTGCRTGQPGQGMMSSRHVTGSAQRYILLLPGLGWGTTREDAGDTR